MKTINKNDLHALIGKETGVSDWLIVEQDRINEFASATGDHQFIHVNPEAAKKTPFGGTIAHGLLTLSLLPKFAEQGTVSLENVVMGVNYGFDKVRFLNPVKTGSKVRGRFTLKDFVEKSPGQFLFTFTAQVEIEGTDKPALFADWLTMQMVA